MPLRLFATQLAAVVEGTEGTPAALVAGNAILVQKLTFSPTQEQYERDVIRGTLSRIPSVSGRRNAKISFEVEMRGGSAEGTIPDYDPLMLGCGFTSTPVEESVTYAPTTESMSKSLTIGLYYDGALHVLQGCRGNVKLSIEAGKPGIFQFEFTAADYVVTDGGLLSATYTSIVPPAFLSGSFTVDSYAAICSKIDIDLGNKVELRSSMNAASGFLSAIITGRLPKGSMEVEQPLISGGYNFYSKWKSGAMGALTITAGSEDGNTINVQCPQVRWSAIKPGDRNGLRTLGMDFEPCLSAGDDEVSIIIT